MLLEKLLEYEKLKDSHQHLQADSLFDEIIYLAFLQNPEYLSKDGSLSYHLEEYAQDDILLKRNIWWAKRPHISSFVNRFNNIRFMPKNIRLNGNWIFGNGSNIWESFSQKRNIVEIRNKICQNYIEHIMEDDIYPVSFLDSIYDDDFEPFPEYWNISKHTLISNPLVKHG